MTRFCVIISGPDRRRRSCAHRSRQRDELPRDGPGRRDRAAAGCARWLSACGRAAGARRLPPPRRRPISGPSSTRSASSTSSTLSPRPRTSSAVSPIRRFPRGRREVCAPAASCVVVEDAPAGVEAARRAGMRCVGVLSTHASLEADVSVKKPSQTWLPTPSKDSSPADRLGSD